MKKYKTNKSLFSLHCSGFVFTPKIPSTLIFILFLPILISLGNWQLHRYNYKTHLEKDYASRPLKKPLLLKDIKNNATKQQFYRLAIFGKYDTHHQLLLENRFYNHKPGFEVLTPFILQNSHKWLLVNRGWLTKYNNNLSDHITIQSDKNQSIIGLIKLPPKHYFILGSIFSGTGWPKKVQAIDLKKISAALNKPVYPFVLLLAPNQSHGFIRKWQPTAMKAKKHLGYAVQWFALSITLVIIYLILTINREKDD